MSLKTSYRSTTALQYINESKSTINKTFKILIFTVTAYHFSYIHLISVV